ncbi:DNA (cytosine-5-)-methyltransferase [Elizabethkingia miricola]|uniref:DNA cytosine methyltransferase n=1 Tax=Elizabethkingia miricola TaxID=172045 RepID=UPI0020190317|nr:DNA (cytosine-5-)-methyltransferase [Elizabethkingia miricola]
MKLIELFSGIGGFTKGLQDAGFEIEEHYFSEIDKHAIANYKYNFPHAKYIGDVKSIQSGDFTGIDIITFGSPCQDFSLAGKRKGLEGSKSSLIQHAIDLVTNIRPSVFIWENVKGAFSSNTGADFWAILQAFANIGGYRLEWQLLNTKWVLPQNRERIYLIGHLDGRSSPGVFPFTEDNFGFNEGEVETTNIRTLTAGGHSGGLHSSMTLIKVNSATSSGFEIATEGDSINFSNPKSKTRRGRVGKGVAQTLDCGCNQAVVQINSSIESGGKQPYQQNRIYDVNGISPCLLKDKSDILINESYFIRRLTEIECERLQGFPDDWTKYGVYEKQVWINKKEGTYEIVEGVKEVPKTQRYKQLGNAVTSEIILQIGLRLKNLMQ